MKFFYLIQRTSSLSFTVKNHLADVKSSLATINFGTAQKPTICNIKVATEILTLGEIFFPTTSTLLLTNFQLIMVLERLFLAQESIGECRIHH